jgi:RNA polymerase primary sigma factor
MGLVRSIAFRYRDLGVPLADLVQEGAIGLLTAIDGYDSSRGASFSTYAFWRIRAAVTHAVTANGHVVRVPRPVLENRRHIADARERLTTAGHDPSVTELAEAMSLPRAAVAELLAPLDVASLDQPTGDGATLGDVVSSDAATSPDSQLLGREQAGALGSALRHLSGRKRAIVSRHFGLRSEPETLTEIAEDLHLSPERTRALKDEALRELALELGHTATGDPSP